MAADLRADSARDTADAIIAAGGQAWSLALDVTDARRAAAAADVQRHAGPIDVLVNNAGILIREGLDSRARQRTGAACWT